MIRFMLWIVLFVSATYMIYAVHLASHHCEIDYATAAPFRRLPENNLEHQVLKIKTQPEEKLPENCVSSDTTRFPYSNRQWHRSGIRISRIVSETFCLGFPDVRWFMMGDDDMVFVTNKVSLP